MKSLKLLTLIALILSVVAAQSNTVPPKPVDPPKVVTASRESSLAFRNLLLEIQNLRLSAERDTARANLLQADLPAQIQGIQKEGKIDTEKYAVMRSSGGAYILSDEGLLQFQLRDTKEKKE